jgi:acyl-homoserine lactone acylase PvdQ
MKRRFLGVVLAGALLTGGMVSAASAARGAPHDGVGADRVTIVRDAHGEPHVFSQSAGGAMYGFAYAQMQDQADYVLANVYKAVGRSAEVEGDACAPNLSKCFQSDQLTHLFRIPEVAYEKFHELSRADQARYRGFADGINAYVRDHPLAVPAWATTAGPVMAQDVVASTEWAFAMAQLTRAGTALKFPTTVAGSAKSARSAAAAASDEPGATGGRFVDILEDPAFRVELPASNMFMVDGSKTASGRPILNSDPHLGWDGATQWYAAKISYPGVSVQGATFRGTPAIGIGYNGFVAWGHTANFNLHEYDAYKEALDPSSPNGYTYGGVSRQMSIRTVGIKVQSAPGAVTTIPVRFRYTIHGPVLTDPPAALDGKQPAPGTSYAGSLTASQYEQVGLGSEMWRKAEAHNIEQFKRAMSNVQLTQYNTGVADRHGVYYVGSSRSGVLKPGVPFNRQPLDGSDPNNTWVSSDPRRPWTGVIPLEDLPQAENPPSGFFENANNTPWTVAPGQIEKSDLPYYMQGGNDGTRSRRLRGLLTAARRLTLAGADRIALDAYVEFAPPLKQLLDQAAAAPGADPRVMAGSALLDGWDNVADPESRAMPLFIAWVRALDPTALGHTTADQGPVVPQEASAEYPDGLVGQPGGFSAAQISEAARAMKLASDAMVAAYGSIAQRYGDLHTIEIGDFHSPLRGGTNDAPTLWMAGCKNDFPASRLVAFPCRASNGSSYIMDVDFADATMHTSKPVADTDDPFSPFFTLNARDFQSGTFRTFPTTYAAVQAEKTSETKLTLPRGEDDDRPARSHHGH